MQPLEGKVALVTGASRGIGRAIALEFARQGAQVCINFKDSEGCAKQVAQTIQEAGGRAIVVQGDVREKPAAQRLVDLACKEYGRLDILVNNAGIIRDGFLITMTDDEWNDVIQTSLYGAFYCTKYATKVMIRTKRGGRVINIASITALIGRGKQANYSAAKGGLIGLTKSLARELAPWKVTVNAIAPGVILTDMNRELPDSEMKRLVEAIPLGRLGTPEDVAQTAAFLASDSSGYITGQTILVDGGFGISS